MNNPGIRLSTDEAAAIMGQLGEWDLAFQVLLIGAAQPPSQEEASARLARGSESLVSRGLLIAGERGDWKLEPALESLATVISGPDFTLRFLKTVRNESTAESFHVGHGRIVSQRVGDDLGYVIVEEESVAAVAARAGVFFGV